MGLLGGGGAGGGEGNGLCTNVCVDMDFWKEQLRLENEILS